jgi:hypothetical protein
MHDARILHGQRAHRPSNATSAGADHTSSRRVLSVLGASTGDVATVSTYARAAVALYGSIVFWYGAWTQLDVGFSQLGYRWASDPDTADGSFANTQNPWCRGSDRQYTPRRDLTYVAVGLVLLLLTDGLYANSGVAGNCWTPPELFQARATGGPVWRCAMQTFGVCRLLVALAGSVLLWLVRGT